MKKLTALIALPLLVAMGSTYAAGNACDAKRVQIEKELAIAKSYNDVSKVFGLQRALTAVTNNCSMDSLIADAQDRVGKIQAKFGKKQSEVTKAESELTEALEANDEKKITKYEERVGEKQQELQELQDELEAAQAELQALKSDS